MALHTVESPSARTRRNSRMAFWLTVAALVTGVIGWATFSWTPVPAIMAPVLLIAGIVYAIMGNTSRHQ